MKKLILQTKSTLGVGPHVSDPVNDEQSRLIDSVDATLKNFARTFGSVQNSIDAAVDVLESGTNIYKGIAGEQSVSEEMTFIGNQFAELTERMRSEAMECKRVLTEGNIAGLQNQVNNCKALNAQRNKVFKDYEVCKKLVELKEGKYNTVDKNLSESKKYTSQVACRDDLKAQLQIRDALLTDEVAALSQSTDKRYRELTRTYVDSYDNFLRSLSAQLNHLRNAADQL